MKKIDIVLVDDHIMLRNGLAVLLEAKGFNVLFEASNGKEFTERLNAKQLPDIVLMDISMPEMNGFETTLWLQKNYPQVKVLALSMFDTESKVIKMLKCGARGYLLKNSKPKELIEAIETIEKSGFYLSDLVNSNMSKALLTNEINNNTLMELTEREIQFLKYCCTELSYKEIATEMNIGHRTVDGYREAIFQKLDIHTRIGLVMYAVKNGIVNI